MHVPKRLIPGPVLCFAALGTTLAGGEPETAMHAFMGQYGSYVVAAFFIGWLLFVLGVITHPKPPRD